MRLPVSLLALLMSGLSAPVFAQSHPLNANLERLAASGNAEAWYHLGMAYHVGIGTARDPRKALDAFRRAAAGGDPLGHYKLGCYFDGQGEGIVADDPVKALAHKQIAAEAGYALAQMDVAALQYTSGAESEALSWVARAAAQGWPEALRTYGLVLAQQTGADRDLVKAAVYLQLYTRTGRAGPADRQALSGIESRLTPAQRDAVAAALAQYRPAPSELTRKALAGRSVAEALVARSR